MKKAKKKRKKKTNKRIRRKKKKNLQIRKRMHLRNKEKNQYLGRTAFLEIASLANHQYLQAYLEIKQVCSQKVEKSKAT